MFQDPLSPFYDRKCGLVPRTSMGVRYSSALGVVTATLLQNNASQEVIRLPTMCLVSVEKKCYNVGMNLTVQWA